MRPDVSRDLLRNGQQRGSKEYLGVPTAVCPETDTLCRNDCGIRACNIEKGHTPSRAVESTSRRVGYDRHPDMEPRLALSDPKTLDACRVLLRRLRATGYSARGLSTALRLAGETTASPDQVLALAAPKLATLV